VPIIYWRAPQYRHHHQDSWFTLYPAAEPAALQRHRRKARHIVVPIMYWRAPQYRHHHQDSWFTLYPAAEPAAAYAYKNGY
jgi:hypothetical protein